MRRSGEASVDGVVAERRGVVGWRSRGDTAEEQGIW